MVVHVGLEIGDGDQNPVRELVAEGDLAFASDRGRGEQGGGREQHGAERRSKENHDKPSL
jgi:hypothetical protein